MSGDHERGEKKGKFCAVPANPICDDCPHDKNYIEVCEPEDWYDHTFERLVNAADGSFTFPKKYEAHHLLCVAPVSQELVSKYGIQGVIRETKWCINNKDNMLAMPLWGHTVKWYCKIGKVKKEIIAGKEAPKFQNIPQHDFDHNCKQGYTWEVEEEVKKLAAEIKASGHKMEGQNLVNALTQLSKKFKTTLDTRGLRKGGTHKAWQLAQKTPPDDNWCHPFSMASDAKVSSKGFPVRVFDAKVAKWMDRIAKAIAGG